MQIEVLHLVEGARQAHGTAVIIDVFRAFSLACYLFDKGAVKIIPVGNIEKAYYYKRIHPDYLLMGERNNRIMPGFDFGNSPFMIKDEDFTGRTVIHTTTAGTQGIVAALHADEVLTGSFVNADALVRYLNNKNPSTISLVCMGYAADHPTEEDTLCAEYLKQKLEKNEPDFATMVQEIRKTSGKRFFKPNKQEHCPKEDFDLCLRLNAFDFIIKAFNDEEFGIVLDTINC